MPEGAFAEPVGSGVDDPVCHNAELVTDVARLRQRAVFLRELAEARALLARSTSLPSPSLAGRQRTRQSI